MSRGKCKCLQLAVIVLLGIYLLYAGLTMKRDKTQISFPSRDAATEAAGR
jgi:hypothetical protein